MDCARSVVYSSSDFDFVVQLSASSVSCVSGGVSDLRCLNARSRQWEDALASCGLQRLEACMLSSASSSGSGLASARFIAVSRRCSGGEKIDGRDMEVGEYFGGRGRCGAHGLTTGSNDSNLAGAVLPLRSVHIP